MALFHYCRNEVLLALLSKRQIWMSDLTLSNDSTEGRWVRHAFVDYCKKAKIESSNIDRLCVHLDSLLNGVRAVGYCLSEEGDLLSQWRGYADGGRGVSIGFKREYLEALCERTRTTQEKFGLALAQVLYTRADESQPIADVTDKILAYVKQGALAANGLLLNDGDRATRQKAFGAMTIAFLQYFPFIFKLKNAAFREEKEWRLLSVVLTGFQAGDLGQLGDVDYRAVEDRFIPYAVLDLPELGIPPIEKIWLGPKNITPTLVMEGMLARFGFKNISIEKSAATYR